MVDIYCMVEEETIVQVVVTFWQLLVEVSNAVCELQSTSMFVVMQEAQKWKPLSFEKIKNDLVWRGLEVLIAYALSD